ncbi:putative potassium ion channel Yvc1 [Aspergillus fischeri NRRL 181]|uniref:Potassium ion channel Yvc1, putative n=1 Tax=Neosartorya fischeri (strain ATCC 1020 / DSM 3700 / CBS 544.65 / FGSC A1164 / JCM 1740 / NRRL 181 / WB 181) TaxID=331117 RepID=A1D678_NEOFI|nr:potassium ion channel Yvc1, putative [Aspergillus fischeri NRRL 181]EAW21222.1 potassium ion channel Yvc1, putative [Aspergillus fischeri NRRL 181]
MGYWGDIFSSGSRTHHHRLPERRRLLPAYRADQAASVSPAKEVTKVALRLKYQIEQVIPFEIDESSITKPNSRIITDEVIQTAKQAGGDDHKGCVVYCLLVCLRWFKLQAGAELWESDLHLRRALACEVIAKRIIESEEDQDSLMKDALLQRYSIFLDGEATTPANVIERAVDLHALRVIGSSGYQKCIKYLWRGWFCQEEGNPTNFVPYHDKDNTDFRIHFHPDRMRTPLYQNACQIFFSLIYLLLYTIVINTVNSTGDLDVVEGILYVMTLSYICDELTKLWKVGRDYFDFWNAFNSTLYTILAVSFFLRVAALTRSSSVNDEQRKTLNQLSYNFLAMAGPMFWMRMMLYLDSFKFFGAMFVVLRVMMKESLIFFALLFVIIGGFFQAFYGMAQADGELALTRGIIQGMANSVMQSPDFGVFEELAFPFGLVLYYLFNFIVMIVLLNILIALYNSAYEDISGNAVDEYMAIFALKTMQFVRAPDENVFIPPFNLLEIIFLVLPFEWWMPREHYAKLNEVIMGIIYSPLLLIIATLETREARRIRWNRRQGEEDDDVVHEWEDVAEEVDFDVDDTWRLAVRDTTPDPNAENCTLEIIQLREQIKELTAVVHAFIEKKDTAEHMREQSSSNQADAE